MRVEEHGPPGQKDGRRDPRPLANSPAGRTGSRRAAGLGLGTFKRGSGQRSSTASEPGATKRMGVAEPRFTVYIKLSPDRTARGHLLVTAAKGKENRDPTSPISLPGLQTCKQTLTRRSSALPAPDLEVGRVALFHRLPPNQRRVHSRSAFFKPRQILLDVGSGLNVRDLQQDVQLTIGLRCH